MLPPVPILFLIALAAAPALMPREKVRLLAKSWVPPRVRPDSTWLLFGLVLPPTLSSAVTEVPEATIRSRPARLPSEASVHGPTALLVVLAGQVIGTTA